MICYGCKKPCNEVLYSIEIYVKKLEVDRSGCHIDTTKVGSRIIQVCPGCMDKVKKEVFFKLKDLTTGQDNAPDGQIEKETQNAKKT